VASTSTVVLERTVGVGVGPATGCAIAAEAMKIGSREVNRRKSIRRYYWLGPE
jgi:hypothetical protein